ncbi:hypothetical protein B0T19DRAFT_432566 [Cercophora scortea]|uniref:Uncharacterized protein n=1 Tax=Cercophora scortea TaxID=314031 RepID=A0AAE0I6I4_9PEZI|nr:hypothetical protein B0T19DRAFT_432566 [Cercophora scortea]
MESTEVSSQLRHCGWHLNANYCRRESGTCSLRRSCSSSEVLSTNRFRTRDGSSLVPVWIVLLGPESAPRIKLCVHRTGLRMYVPRLHWQRRISVIPVCRKSANHGEDPSTTLVRRMQLDDTLFHEGQSTTSFSSDGTHAQCVFVLENQPPATGSQSIAHKSRIKHLVVVRRSPA